ncbi:hypothetical protein AB0M48_07115 [Lentzea sp. NPDC051208]|uniref:hypothetical protein n=1 Tax=Lentzea sp. NPDC051208 TaxID=3154642 RepID=UPI003438FA1D
MARTPVLAGDRRERDATGASHFRRADDDAVHRADRCVLAPLLVIALRFVNPAQLVTRLDDRLDT